MSSNKSEEVASLSRTALRASTGSRRRKQGKGARPRTSRTNAETTKIQNDLWEYGFRVLKNALRTGDILKMCADAGQPVFMTEEVRRTLHSSLEDRDELVTETLLHAVPYFRRKVLETQRHNPERASLKTFFIGCCVRAFPTIFASWQRARNRRLAELGLLLPEEFLDEADLRVNALSPQDLVALRETLRTIMQHARPEARKICALLLHDLTYAEIGAKLDGISARAVEGHMSRLRSTVRRLGRLGKIDLPAAQVMASTTREAS